MFEPREKYVRIVFQFPEPGTSTSVGTLFVYSFTRLLPLLRENKKLCENIITAPYNTCTYLKQTEKKKKEWKNEGNYALLWVHFIFRGGCLSESRLSVVRIAIGRFIEYLALQEKRWNLRAWFLSIARFGRTILSQNWTCRSSVIYWVSHYQLVPNKDVLWKARMIGHSLSFWDTFSFEEVSHVSEGNRK